MTAKRRDVYLRYHARVVQYNGKPLTNAIKDRKIEMMRMMMSFKKTGKTSKMRMRTRNEDDGMMIIMAFVPNFISIIFLIIIIIIISFSLALPHSLVHYWKYLLLGGSSKLTKG